MNIFLHCGLLLTVSVSQRSAWPTLKLDIYDYRYDVIEPNYIDFNITKVRPTGHIIYLNVLRDNIDLYARTSIYYENGKNQFTTEFMNKTISVCRLIHDSRYEPFLKLLYRLAVELSPEYLNKCPIRKKVYFLKMVDFESDKIPPVMPDKPILVTAKYYAKEKNNFKYLVFFSLYFKLTKK